MIGFLVSETTELNALINGNKKAYKERGSGHIAAHPFRTLAAATRNSGPDCFIGKGGFCRVYKYVTIVWRAPIRPGHEAT